MKKKVGLFLLISMILGGTGVLLYHAQSKSNNGQNNGNGSIVEEVLAQKLCILKTNIVRIETKEDNTIVLEKHGGEWKNPDVSSLVYDKNMIYDWLIQLRALESTEAIYGAQDPMSYGIDENSFMLTIYDEMNNSQTFRIGKKSEDKVYVMCDQLEGIFSISLEESDILQKNLNDFIVSHLNIPGKEKTASITLLNGADAYLTIKKADVAGTSKWLLMDHYKTQHDVQQEVITQLLDEIQALKPQGFAGVVSEVEDYGLTKPQYGLVLNDAYTLSFGKTTDKTIYVKENDSNIVYEIDKAFFDQISSIKPFEIISKQVFNTSLERVKQVLLENPQGKYSLTLQVEKKEANKRIVGKINELLLDEEQTKELVATIQESIWLEAELQNPEIEQKEERKAEITITYTLIDGTEGKIELLPYDINYYILRYNGNIEFAVNKDKITKLFSDLSHMEK